MIDLASGFEEAAGRANAGQLADAREIYTGIIARGSLNDQARAHALRGWCFFQEKQYVLAMSDFNKAIAVVPDAENTIYLRARCREELDDPVGALTDFEHVICLNPDTPDAWAGASMIHSFFGREQEAEKCSRMAAAARARVESPGDCL